MSSGIYYIQNLTNSKIYIGQSRDMSYRLNAHRWCLRGKTPHRNPHLQHAWNKYGEKSFRFGMLEECAEDKLDEREILYIKHFRQRGSGCYNCDSGGSSGYIFTDDVRARISAAISGENNPMYGKRGSDAPGWKRKWSQESRDKISKNRKGKCAGEDHPFFGDKFPQETRQKAIAAITGKPRSEETRRKLSQIMTGKKHTNIAKLKVAQASKNRKHSQEAKRKISAKRATFKPFNTMSQDIKDKIKRNRKRVCDPALVQEIQSLYNTGEWTIKALARRFDFSFPAIKKMLMSTSQQSPV